METSLVVGGFESDICDVVIKHWYDICVEVYVEIDYGSAWTFSVDYDMTVEVVLDVDFGIVKNVVDLD